MRAAIFSDVHGNLSALKAVLGHIESQPAKDQVIFAGDAGLFGPRPQECIDTIIDWGPHCLVGNTDVWIRKPPPLDRKLEEPARQRRKHIQDLCLWTEERLDRKALSWLESLESSFQLRLSPTSTPENDLLIVHANPRDLAQVIFPDQKRQIALYNRVRQVDKVLEPLFIGVQAAVVAIGHLHIPGIRVFGEFTLANISSVSMPGDGDSRAKYAIITWNETGGWVIEYLRVSYPISEEIKAFNRERPPGWKRSIQDLKRFGHVPQII